MNSIGMWITITLLGVALVAECLIRALFLLAMTFSLIGIMFLCLAEVDLEDMLEPALARPVAKLIESL